jgi:hypothetical protein
MKLIQVTNPDLCAHLRPGDIVRHLRGWRDEVNQTRQSRPVRAIVQYKPCFLSYSKTWSVRLTTKIEDLNADFNLVDLSEYHYISSFNIHKWWWPEDAVKRLSASLAPPDDTVEGEINLQD